MTKQEALQKIEELKKFVEKCDDEGTLEHGDLLLPTRFPEEGERIIIKTEHIKEEYLKYDYLAFDKGGHVVNYTSGDRLIDLNDLYTKIRNVFKD